MSMQVSFRIKNLKGGEASGAVAHDFRRKVPNYVDRTRTPKNTILFGGQPDVSASIKEQGERVRARTGKKLRKDANLFLSGILTFSHDARGLVNAAPPDQQAREFAKKFAEENRVRLLYLVRHSDETTVHYHFMTENVTSDGESLKNKLSPSVLSSWQDQVGEVFSEIGIGRGTPKSVRIARGDDYAKVIHRRVRQLHENLPGEIAREESRLRDVAKRRADLEGDLQKAIWKEAKNLPPLPVEEEVEIVAEQTFWGGTKTRTVKVFRVKPVKKFFESLAHLLAATQLFEREVIPREDYRRIQGERDILARNLAESRQKLVAAQERISRMEQAMEKAKAFISWIKEGFPNILPQYISLQKSRVAKEEKDNHPREKPKDSMTPK